jgi:hypothetical protein
MTAEKHREIEKKQSKLWNSLQLCSSNLSSPGVKRKPKPPTLDKLVALVTHWQK